MAGVDKEGIMKAIAEYAKNLLNPVFPQTSRKAIAIRKMETMLKFQKHTNQDTATLLKSRFAEVASMS